MVQERSAYRALYRALALAGSNHFGRCEIAIAGQLSKQPRTNSARHETIDLDLALIVQMPTHGVAQQIDQWPIDWDEHNPRAFRAIVSCSRSRLCIYLRDLKRPIDNTEEAMRPYQPAQKLPTTGVIMVARRDLPLASKTADQAAVRNNSTDTWIARSKSGTSRRRFLKFAGSALAAVGAPAVIIPGRLRAASPLIVALWGGSFAEAFKAAYLDPFTKLDFAHFYAA
jgi:hypothetical protein